MMRNSTLGADGAAESRPSHVAISGVAVRVLVVRSVSLAVHIDLLSASCSLQAMATRKAAESTLYHLSPRGFWKKFRAYLRLVWCALFEAHIAVDIRRGRRGHKS